MAGVTSSTYLDFLKTGKYSDFTIICKDVEFKVHKVVLCGSSSMLDTACKGGFKEATSGKIEFPEDDPEVMARVVLFMYTGDYDADKAPSTILPSGYSIVAGTPETKTESSAAEKPKSRRIKASTEATPAQSKSGVGQTIDKRSFEVLTINALVYKCADMLGIQNLMMLAAERFLADCPVAYTDERFAPPLRTMFESTRSDDEHLRLPVTTLCVKSHSLLPALVAAVVQEHEYNVWRIYVPILLGGLNGKTEDQIKRETLEDVAFLQARYCPCCYIPVTFLLNNDNKVTGYCKGTGCQGRVTLGS
ncbi:hypothetical protein H2200_008910 [Cladophialophora chaetospira]|uniref:BTB domain-containing protein n=1 Tax=Cladophialophora chaetospira TaxID=386627 RepID=A0AA38X508_9EURO|nr:hypothetical protein H2200_008910 [Cladophialophora chaetospira]